MIKLNPKFKAIKSKDCPRYVILTGGRGSSKSFGIATLMAERACSPGHQILYTRYTMASAAISIIPELEEKLDMLGVAESFKTSGNIITNEVNGSKIIFQGIKMSSGNQTAKLKSLQGINTWVLDEADELQSEEDFDTIDMSIRTKTQKNQIILILNPTTTDHWIWDRWFETSHKTVQIDGCDVHMSTHPDVLHLHFTYLENEQHLNEDIVKIWRNMRSSNFKKYSHRIIGGWLDTREGVVFSNWREGKFDDNFPWGYGMDYGFADPLAVIRVSVDKKNKLIYLQEIGYDSAVEDVPEYLRKKRVDKRKMLISDVNEPRTTLAVAKAGFNIIKAKKKKIAEDIRILHNYTFVVDPESYNLKKELRNYIWNDKKSDTPIDDFNHLLDAMRYIVFRLISRRSRGIKTKNRR